MLGKEDAAAGKKLKQAVMQELLTPSAKTSAESSSQIPGSKELDAKIVSYLYENDIAFNSSSSLALMIEESMNFARQICFKVTRYLIDSNFQGIP